MKIRRAPMAVCDKCGKLVLRKLVQKVGRERVCVDCRKEAVSAR